MKKIDWSDKYSVGIPEIDTQHKQIVDEINKLAELVNKQEHSEEAHAVLRNIMVYATRHLSYEEDLLIDNDYPGYEQHHDCHNKYRLGFYSIFADPNEPLENKMDFLRQWWNQHILEEDMKYKPFFQENEINQNDF